MVNIRKLHLKLEELVIVVDHTISVMSLFPTEIVRDFGGHATLDV